MSVPRAGENAQTLTGLRSLENDAPIGFKRCVDLERRGCGLHLDGCAPSDAHAWMPHENLQQHAELLRVQLAHCGERARAEILESIQEESVGIRGGVMQARG